MAQKAVLITGCSTGIGYDAAKGLSKAGYRVLATCRSQADVDRLNAEGLESFVLDLQSSESIEAGFAETMERTGGELYGVFHNGAYGQMGAVEDLDTDVLRQAFEANFFGWHHLTTLVMKVFRKQGFGRVILNSSMLGFVAMPLRGAYNSSKFATEGLYWTMRQELVKHPEIFVSLIEPGPILTDFRKNAHKSLDNLDMETSFHKSAYGKMKERLGKEGAAVPGTLGPESVTKRVLHALESKNPKKHYYVTWPTWWYMVLRRAVPTRFIDRYLTKF